MVPAGAKYNPWYQVRTSRSRSPLAITQDRATWHSCTVNTPAQHTPEAMAAPPHSLRQPALLLALCALGALAAAQPMTLDLDAMDDDEDPADAETPMTTPESELQEVAGFMKEFWTAVPEGTKTTAIWDAGEHAAVPSLRFACCTL